ncbi:Retrovirus-related Pol polyprotein from transposon TNT 1-94 [Cucumis melo var. makuwa]|uniref:Retrovirus-related Pol polyprotein from transposon TNT 1-94 n=1 Tax=Cucumis melo var. makuwa TaxID=1194695 RepID=A0A5A7T068_CUCMM|nr:Retrovirus-related Pol polyprotein from transposon TNT 1-94 [Cucumis melo var. makuwa]TYK27341.1 Retrovirus-related Pol polyprotein from transposon TNT 1-94 [Cucumis melo var. makuwa]
MTSNYSLMTTPSSVKSLPPIYAADGNCMNITHIGTINTPNLNLSHTYCVPNLTFNLVSVGQLCDLGLTVSFSPNGCQVQDPQTGQTIGTSRKVGRLFELLSLQVSPPSSISAPVTDSDTYQWHLRLGHASPKKLCHLISGTLVQRSCPHTSQQNGCVERKHRHVLESVHALLLFASCPEKFWGEVALTFVYTINRLPSSVLQNISPFERLYGTPPNYSNLKVFGCACFILLHPHEHTKLEPRARLCCFLGYVRISRHVTFWEHTMFSRLSSFHSSFSSPQPFFTDTSAELFPLFEFTPDTELTQSTPAPANSNQSSVSDDGPEHTLDTPLRRSTRKAMNDELQALGKTHTWDYVDLPPGKRLIGYKWIYKIKTHSDAVAAAKQYPFLYMDVKNALLNGTLSEVVYMKPPPGTSPPPHKGIVLLLLYIDDMIITGNDPQTISDLQHYLGQYFEMKDLGFLNYFLGLEVSRCSDGYLLSQAKYVSDLLVRSGITDSNITSTPLDPNIHLTPYDGVPLEGVSRLTVSRLDITYVVHIVSQFMAAPRTIHFTSMLRILRYIKGILGHGLQFSSQSSLVLSSYSDADWTGDPTDRRSTIGYCFYLGDSLISWRSKKQSVVSRSSTELEYRALADAIAELL